MSTDSSALHAHYAQLVRAWATDYGNLQNPGDCKVTGWPGSCTWGTCSATHTAARLAHDQARAVVQRRHYPGVEAAITALYAKGCALVSWASGATLSLDEAIGAYWCRDGESVSFAPVVFDLAQSDI